MTDKHFSSRMLTLAGGLMTLSGILTALLGRLAENAKAKEDPPTDRKKRD